MDTNELIKSLQKQIKDKTSEAKESMKEVKANIKEVGDSSVQLLRLETKLKKLQAEEKMLDELNEAFKAIKGVKTKEIKLAKVVEAKLNDVATMVTKEELKELNGLLKKSLQAESKKAKNEIQESYLKASKALKRLNLNRAQNSLKKYRNKKMEEVTVAAFKVNPKAFKIETNKIVALLEKRVKEEHYNLDPKVRLVVRNFNNIKENYLTVDNASEAILKINNLIDTLKKNTEVDFSNTIKYLEKIKRRYVKDKDAAQKYLYKFDISSIIKK